MARFCLEVSGRFACFTRPEMKAERVSYDVITPSAVRAVFESILWKPAMRWQPEKIEVLSPIRWVSMRRNELGSVVPVGNVRSAMKSGRGNLGVYIEDDRQQRAGLFLRDVRYRLTARMELTKKAQAGDTQVKFAEMFKRRAGKGQCINQPYLGCREFACRFQLVDEREMPTLKGHLEEGDKLLLGMPQKRPLGWMLYDMDYTDATMPQPRFFNPCIENGVIAIPEWDSPEVRG